MLQGVMNYSYWSPRTLAKLILYYMDLIWGLVVFYTAGKTPHRAYIAMIQLHCLTSGWLTSVLGKLFARTSTRSPDFIDGNSWIKPLSRVEVDSICKEINEKGYCKFDFTLDEETVSKLESIALNYPSTPDYKNGEETREEVFYKDVVGASEAKVYRLLERETIKNDLVQSIMGDSFFYNIARKYLQSTPILCSVNMWWSTLFGNSSSSDKEAQCYHFDMSRARWLNFFVYLKDVDSENGPHCYVEGSHKIEKGSPGHELLRRGYNRISDSDMEKAFGKDKIKEFHGRKGTILAVDTKGFHKGKTPVSGERLMFEMVFSNSLFGGSYLKFDLSNPDNSFLKTAYKYSPDTYQRYR